MSQSLATAHINIVCSDDVLRRFYIDRITAPYSDSTKGYVIYNGAKVVGEVIRVKGLHVFKPSQRDTPIPKKAGWHLHPNCCAPKHCERTRTCKGGCKK